MNFTCMAGRAHHSLLTIGLEQLDALGPDLLGLPIETHTSVYELGAFTASCTSSVMVRRAPDRPGLASSMSLWPELAADAHVISGSRPASASGPVERVSPEIRVADGPTASPGFSRMV
jgi:hypothetical protein